MIINHTEKRVFKIKLPVKANISKTKRSVLNLNAYRNMHYHVQNTQKKNFSNEVLPQLRHIPKLGKISLHYIIFVKTNHRFDLMNIGSILDKYFSDILTYKNIIEDDDYKHINFVSFSFGGVKPEIKENYALVTITEIEKRKKEKPPMKIFLDDQEIENALNNYIETLNITGSTSVDLKVIDNKIQAEIVVQTHPIPTTMVKKTKGRGRPPKSKDSNELAISSEDNINNNSSGVIKSTENKVENSNSEDKETSGETEEGKKSKNLFGESQEESSKKNNSGNEVKVTTTKKRSIFDS